MTGLTVGPTLLLITYDRIGRRIGSAFPALYAGYLVTMVPGS